MNGESNSSVSTWRTLPRAERRFALAIAAALILLTGLPYLYGWLRTPPGYVYTGVHAISPMDMAVYRSVIEQVRDGHAFTVSLFSADPGRLPALELFWLPVGLLARALDLPAALAIHLVRLALIIPFVILLTALIATIIPDRARIRRLALLLVAFSSGIGAWTAGYLDAVGTVRDGYQYLPIDLWTAEANTFLTLLQYPHMVASLTLILWGVLSLMRFHRTGRWRWCATGALAAGLLVTFHPYYALTVIAIPFLWTVYSLSVFRHASSLRVLVYLSAVAMAIVPGTLYHLWRLFADPVVLSHANQNILTTPTPFLVLLGYGALIPLALVGLTSPQTWRSPERRMLAVWIIATFALAYTPVPWQRKLLKGLHVGLAIAAALGVPVVLAWIHCALPERVRRIVWSRATALWVAVPLFGFSTISILAQDIAFFTVRFPTHIPPTIVYYPTPAIDAMRWIRSNTTRTDGATLALGIDGAYLPMFAARTSVMGTPHETADYARKRVLVETITRGDHSPADAAATLDRLRVRYLLVTAAEAHRWRIDPATIPGVTLAYENANAKVYAFRTP